MIVFIVLLKNGIQNFCVTVIGDVITAHYCHAEADLFLCVFHVLGDRVFSIIFLVLELVDSMVGGEIDKILAL